MNEYLSLNQNSGSVWTYSLFIYLPQWYIVGLPLFTWVNCQNSPWKLRSLWDRYEKNEVLIFYPPSYCGHCGHLILVNSWAQVADVPSPWQGTPRSLFVLVFRSALDFDMFVNCAFSQTSPQLGDTISPILIHDKPSHPTYYWLVSRYHWVSRFWIIIIYHNANKLDSTTPNKSTHQPSFINYIPRSLMVTDGYWFS